MWSRELLKSNAKQCLARTWKTTILVVIAYSILSGSLSATVSSNVEVNQISPSFWTIFGVASLIGAVIGIFLISPLHVGYYRYFMEARQGDAPFGSLFGAFRKGDYGNITLGMFMTDLKIFLFSLLLIIPGLIKTYEYALVPYLLAENPQMDYRRAQQLSRDIMRGEKLNLAILELSFMGWALLGALLVSVLGVFLWILLLPLSFLFEVALSTYMDATRAEFYAAMREKAFAQNLSNPEELGGFIAY